MTARNDTRSPRGDKLFCVVADAGAAHEAECVYSIWETLAEAQLEIDRLVRENIEPGCNGGAWSVVPYELGTPRDMWIAP